MVNIKNHFTARTGELEKSNQDFDTASKLAMKHHVHLFYHIVSMMAGIVLVVSDIRRRGTSDSRKPLSTTFARRFSLVGLKSIC